MKAPLPDIGIDAHRLWPEQIAAGFTWTSTLFVVFLVQPRLRALVFLRQFVDADRRCSGVRHGAGSWGG